MESSREQARRWVLRELDRHLVSAVQPLTEAQTDRQAVNLEPRYRYSAAGLRHASSLDLALVVALRGVSRLPPEDRVLSSRGQSVRCDKGAATTPHRHLCGWIEAPSFSLSDFSG
jgi:hypothetical protein